MDESGPPEPNMTPMIDVVFQLIIFLMMANDMTRRDLADMDLPFAPRGLEDAAAPGRLTVNLLRAPAGGPPRLLFRGRAADMEGLRLLLREHRTGSTGSPRVLIRADRGTPWLHVQHVMQACADPAVDVSGLEFATTGHAPGKGGRP